MAGDGEVGVRRRVPGLTVECPGAALPPPARFVSILRASRDSSLGLEVEGPTLVVRGSRSEFALAAEDPDAHPGVPDHGFASCHEAAAADLRRLARLTMFATDPESTRYALGGVLTAAGWPGPSPRPRRRGSRTRSTTAR